MSSAAGVNCVHPSGNARIAKVRAIFFKKGNIGALNHCLFFVEFRSSYYHMFFFPFQFAVAVITSHFKPQKKYSENNVCNTPFPKTGGSNNYMLQEES